MTDSLQSRTLKVIATLATHAGRIDDPTEIVQNVLMEAMAIASKLQLTLQLASSNAILPALVTHAIPEYPFLDDQQNLSTLAMKRQDFLDETVVEYLASITDLPEDDWYMQGDRHQVTDAIELVLVKANLGTSMAFNPYVTDD